MKEKQKKSKEKLNEQNEKRNNGSSGMELRYAHGRPLRAKRVLMLRADDDHLLGKLKSCLYGRALENFAEIRVALQAESATAVSQTKWQFFFKSVDYNVLC